MAKLAITVKFLFVWLYNGFASFIMHGVIASTLPEASLTWSFFLIISFLMFMVFLPELLFLTSKVFRDFILEGIRGPNKRVRMEDLKKTSTLYVSLWCMRIFMALNIGVFFEIKIDAIIYLAPLLGSFGTAGLAILTKAKPK